MSGRTDQIRRSVEVEYWVIDDEGRLTDPGPAIDAPGAEREFVDPILEIKTTPCDGPRELREELYERIERAVTLADEADRHLVPLATPLQTAGSITELPADRTRIQNAVVGDAFGWVRRCAGTHVHVEQTPGAAADQLNALIALDPALALVNSATHARGERIAAGARSVCYRRRAYDAMPHQGRLWPYVTDTDEWERRVERRYEEFITAAHEAGLDRHSVEAAFDPESAIWTPVQLRPTFGTVEWRSPDTALPSQICALADQVASVAAHAGRGPVEVGGETGHVTSEGIVLPAFDALLERLDAAIETGLDDVVVRQYLDEMGFDLSAFDPIAAALPDRETITVEQARALRLEYADRLRADLERVQPTLADD
ncbi:glutamate-cysteine ligase family protein [Halococcoides cellulosivorans]|uniref:Glutamate--cysteine ligase n=1 Tax=Halococcoides cellulosivorans TaxID=1679096 RepID=A0A2R4WZN2_9EURY|nr:glutamate-cysteine ligase family protein [Halococcoides cellulosivorans]AWB26987.1 glutamate--cysteine ligase [Halococcoides cellulosivorans]